MVNAKLAELGITPRTIPEDVAALYEEKLEKIAGKTVVIKARSTDEPTTFAKSLQQSLLRAHIKATVIFVKPGTWDGVDLPNEIESSMAGSGLADVIAALIKAVTGFVIDKGPQVTQTTAAADVTVMIGEKELLTVPRPPRQ